MTALVTDGRPPAGEIVATAATEIESRDFVQRFKVIDGDFVLAICRGSERKGGAWEAPQAALTVRSVQGPFSFNVPLPLRRRVTTAGGLGRTHREPDVSDARAVLLVIVFVFAWFSE